MTTNDTSSSRSPSPAPALSNSLSNSHAPAPSAPSASPDVEGSAAQPEPSRVEALRAALTMAPSASGGLWLLLSLGLFVLAGSDHKLFDLVVLVAVIAIHEAGHALAMLVFGYRDVRVFFVPFMGGVATGKKTGAPPWQQAIVLFMGPVPGVAIGAALAIVAAVTEDPRFTSAGLIFISVNGFNLLPFPPLDGGRLFEIALFARHRILEMAFAGGSGLVLVALAVWLRAPGLGLLAFLALVTLPYRSKLRAQVDAVRAVHGTLPDDPAAVSDDALLALDASAAEILPPAQAQQHGTTVRALWERLAAPTTTLLASFAIVFAWGVSVVGLLVAVVVFAVAQRPPQGDDNALPQDAAAQIEATNRARALEPPPQASPPAD